MRRASYGIFAALAFANFALVAAAGPRLLEVRRTVGRTGASQYELVRARLPLSQVRLSVHDVQMRRELDALLRARRAELVFNGGFYGMQGGAEGLVVSGGRVLAPWLRSIGGGILSVRAARAALHDGELEPRADVLAADFAMQCRPRLIVAGRVNIRTDDGRRADRTALCIRDGGAVIDAYVARASEPLGNGGPTLFQLAQALLADGCEAALNLDGGPSTAMAWRSRSGIVSMPARTGIRHAVAVSHASR